eukprot:5716729-Prymnesium_polylepis.1
MRAEEALDCSITTCWRGSCKPAALRAGTSSARSCRRRQAAPTHVTCVGTTYQGSRVTHTHTRHPPICQGDRGRRTE